jgi:hypothetical protein
VEPPLVEDGSGAPVRIAGDAFVLVRMEPASGFDLETGEGELVYKGPRRISGADAGAETLRELVRTGDFEAVLGWAVGLDDRVDFRVRTLDEPPRLVVDFATDYGRRVAATSASSGAQNVLSAAAVVSFGASWNASSPGREQISRYSLRAGGCRASRRHSAVAPAVPTTSSRSPARTT